MHVATASRTEAPVERDVVVEPVGEDSPDVEEDSPDAVVGLVAVVVVVVVVVQEPLSDEEDSPVVAVVVVEKVE